MTNPFLTVSDTTLDVDFASSFTVLRRVQVVDANGWNQPGTQTLSALGTVVSANSNSLSRLPESQRQEKSIEVVTNFPLRGASKDALGAIFEPDLILYQGNYYVVVLVDDLTKFGGQVEVVAQMTDYTPSAPGTAN